MSGIFHRALGCICTVFRICDCSTSRGHLNPDRSGKKSHKSLSVSSNCHVWWKRWTNMFQDFYQMYPMRLDVCVLPLLESVLNSHNLQRCFDLDFKNWVVSWVFSLLNGLILTQIPVFFLSKTCGFICKEWLWGGEICSVCAVDHNTGKMRESSECELKEILERETGQENPPENWHWAQCLFPGICEESHLKEVDRPSFTFLKLFFKKVPVTKYRSQMCYSNQLDQKSELIWDLHYWQLAFLWSNRSISTGVGRTHSHPYPSTFWFSLVYTLPMEFIPMCTHLTAQSNQISDIRGFLKRPFNLLTYVF